MEETSNIAKVETLMQHQETRNFVRLKLVNGCSSIFD
jgi:hypothetical protein